MMPIETSTLSFSQFAELMAIDDPARIIAVVTDGLKKEVKILLEPDDADTRHASAPLGQHQPATAGEGNGHG